MKKLLLSAFVVLTALIALNSCKKEPILQQAQEVVDGMDKKLVPATCPLYAQNTTSYFTLGSVLFGDGVNNFDGTMDDHLNCPTDYFDRCDVVTVDFLEVIGYDPNPGNVNGYTHPLNDGIMSVAEQTALATQIKNACRNHLDQNYSTNHIVTDYEVHFVSPMCCNSMVVYVNFTAAKHCRN